MAALPRSAARNGVSGPTAIVRNPAVSFTRFQDVPSAIDIPLPGEDGEQEAVEVDLEGLDDDPTELCTLLENEQISKNIWMTIAMAYAKHNRIDLCISIVNQAIQAFKQMKSNERLSLLTALCWLYLHKCRDAPRVQSDGSGAPTKETYIGLATTTLNEASRINHTYPPLFLVRGVLSLLKASLSTLSRSAVDSRAVSERTDNLRLARKCFDDADRASGGTNIMAAMGKARVHYSLREYVKALEAYQDVLARDPSLIDPDPRIGIGCCLWNLNNRDQAKVAWERALELNPSSKLASMLIGVYYLQLSSQIPTTDPQFAEIYKKGMTQYAQAAFKLPGGNRTPLICSVFASHFLRTQAYPQVEKLARTSVENTDVNAIASDGWYLLARKEHYSNNLSKAVEYYTKADAARGDDPNFVGAKFGLTQIRIQRGEYAEAKFRLEKLVQTTKSVEAMTLLGMLLAEEVFSNAPMADPDREKSRLRASQLLENVRLSWNSPNKQTLPDPTVLLTLARLLETSQPEKSQQCLLQVEQLEFEAAKTESGIHNETEDESALKVRLRKFLPPQLLNNIGCFHYQAGRLALSREYFQSALDVCRSLAETSDGASVDGISTSITFNLARALEEEKKLDDARVLYEELLGHHAGYIDGKIRLAYIKIRQHPHGEGPKAVQELFQAHPNHLGVRALYGWYLGRAKKKTMNIAEDQEQRHYKHTLQQFNKHDKYALTGMGNIHLSIAREMRRDTEQDRDRRHKMYQRSVEFFDKALQLDPQNAYAAQGIGIALVEDKKDCASAIQLFSRAKDSINDHNVLINLGHAFAELRQFSRSIENYMLALSKDRGHDAQLLSCLGRVWLMKGRQEKDLSAMQTSLDFSKRALVLQPDHGFSRFNVAFVQSQIAQHVYTLSESQRRSEDIREAAAGLDEAIETFTSVAQSPHPPFPRNDIEQRANMGRNTTKKQLERALQAQEEYERRNRDKIEKARELREVEQRRRDEEKRLQEEAAMEKRRQIEHERELMRERDREFAERKAEAQRLRDEVDMTTDEETGERRKRVRRKSSGVGGRRRAEHGSDNEDEDGEDGEAGGDSDAGARRTKKRKQKKRRAKSGSRSPAGSDEEGGAGDGGGDGVKRTQKKRKLETRASSKKFKSAEIVEESDMDDDEDEVTIGGGGGASEKPSVASRTRTAGPVDSEDDDDDDAEVEAEPTVSRTGNSRQRKQLARVVGDDDDDDEDGDGDDNEGEADADADVGDGYPDDDGHLSPLPDLDDSDDDLNVDIEPAGGGGGGGSDVDMDD